MLGATHNNSEGGCTATPEVWQIDETVAESAEVFDADQAVAGREEVGQAGAERLNAAYGIAQAPDGRIVVSTGTAFAPPASGTVVVVR